VTVSSQKEPSQPLNQDKQAYDRLKCDVWRRSGLCSCPPHHTSKLWPSFPSLHWTFPPSAMPESIAWLIFGRRSRRLAPQRPPGAQRQVGTLFLWCCFSLLSVIFNTSRAVPSGSLGLDSRERVICIGLSCFYDSRKWRGNQEWSGNVDVRSGDRVPRLHCRQQSLLKPRSLDVTAGLGGRWHLSENCRATQCRQLLQKGEMYRDPRGHYQRGRDRDTQGHLQAGSHAHDLEDKIWGPVLEVPVWLDVEASDDILHRGHVRLDLPARRAHGPIGRRVLQHGYFRPQPDRLVVERLRHWPHPLQEPPTCRPLRNHFVGRPVAHGRSQVCDRGV